MPWRARRQQWWRTPGLLQPQCQLRMPTGWRRLATWTLATAAARTQTPHHGHLLQRQMQRASQHQAPELIPQAVPRHPPRRWRAPTGWLPGCGLPRPPHVTARLPRRHPTMQPCCRHCSRHWHSASWPLCLRLACEGGDDRRRRRRRRSKLAGTRNEGYNRQIICWMATQINIPTHPLQTTLQFYRTPRATL